MKRREALKTSALLTGCGLSIGTISAIMSGCKSEPTVSAAPGSLSDQQKELIAEVAEMIIPETDTPGAKSAGVPEDLFNHLEYNFTEEDRVKFVEGLSQFEEVAGKSFLSSTEEERIAALTELANKGGEENIFNAIKGLTTYLFFTSEKGAKEVLIYDPIPGGYTPCVDYDEVGGAWAL